MKIFSNYLVFDLMNDLKYLIHVEQITRKFKFRLCFENVIFLSRMHGVTP